MIMDEYGSLFACGNVADGTTYFANFDVDHPYDIFNAKLSYYFTVHGQPEQARLEVDAPKQHWQCWHVIGKSGTAYMIGRAEYARLQNTRPPGNPLWD